MVAHSRPGTGPPTSGHGPQVTPGSAAAGTTPTSASTIAAMTLITPPVVWKITPISVRLLRGESTARYLDFQARSGGSPAVPRWWRTPGRAPDRRHQGTVPRSLPARPPPAQPLRALAQSLR